LRPNRIGEVSQNLAWKLDTAVANETVVIEDEWIIQRGTINCQDGDYDRGSADPKGGARGLGGSAGGLATGLTGLVL
jgi:hypothetical protein